MTRKIIQIAVSDIHTDRESEDDYVQWLYALCDDGSLWVIDAEQMSHRRTAGWEPVPAIPQGVNEQSKES